MEAIVISAAETTTASAVDAAGTIGSAVSTAATAAPGLVVRSIELASKNKGIAAAAAIAIVGGYATYKYAVPKLRGMFKKTEKKVALDGQQIIAATAAAATETVAEILKPENNAGA